MARYFYTAGPCLPELHFMLPPELRLPTVRRLAVQGRYFTLHAPRQSEKTTLVRTLARGLPAPASRLGAFPNLHRPRVLWPASKASWQQPGSCKRRRLLYRHHPQRHFPGLSRRKRAGGRRAGHHQHQRLSLPLKQPGGVARNGPLELPPHVLLGQLFRGPGWTLRVPAATIFPRLRAR